MIKVQNMSFSYELRDGQSLQALKGISLEIREAESVAIIGSNGSGKSTLALCLNGLLIPQSGQVRVDGLEVRPGKDLEEIRRRVGMIFQNPDNQIISTTVEREIAFGLENLAYPQEQLRARVEEILEQFHLVPFRHRPPHMLSGGEKQRLSIAAVLAMRPSYLILDEPTSLLDPLSRMEVRQLLTRLRDREKVTVVHITQFPEEAAQAQRVLVLHGGELVMEGPPQEVFRQGERLAQLGLKPPFAVDLAHRLRMTGMDLTGPVDCLEALAGSIADIGRRASSARGRTNKSDRGDARIPGPERIRTEDLCHRYNPGLPTERIALKQVNLSIRQGEVVGLVGAIGSGKSTLVQHLNALLEPFSGKVLVDGQRINEKGIDLQKLRQKVGLVFQFPEKQLFEETVHDDVAFGPRNLGLPEAEADQRVYKALELVGLETDRFAGRSPFDLSGGEQRRVAIAGVLALEPELLILDEPFVGLDPGGCEQILDIIGQLRDQGKTIILITHHMDLLAPIADRLVVMKEGGVAADDTPGAVFDTPEHAAELGIELPQAVELSLLLKEQGWDVTTPALSVEQAVEMIGGRRQ